MSLNLKQKLIDRFGNNGNTNGFKTLFKYEDEILDAKEKGFNVKEIYTILKEDKIISCSYRQFLRYFAKLFPKSKEEKKLHKVENNTTQVSNNSTNVKGYKRKSSIELNFQRLGPDEEKFQPSENATDSKPHHKHEGFMTPEKRKELLGY